MILNFKFSMYVGILSQEDKIVTLVEYMIGDFCQNGVPEQDVQFCQVLGTINNSRS